MPNSLAYLSLIAWPFVMLFLLKRFGTAKGILLSLLIAYLLLPARFGLNFPGIPELNKYTLTSVVLLSYLVMTRRKIGIKSLKNWHMMTFSLLMISPFLTSLTNSEPYLFIQGLTLYDGLSRAGTDFLLFFPFLLGLAYFNTYERQVLLLRFVAIGAVLYTLPVLWEVRMSPQLHTTLYGYFPHSFAQQHRAGGFRAVVFLGHGLLVATFLAVGFTCLFALHKARVKAWRFDNKLLLFLLFATIILQKSYGAFAYALLAVITIAVLSPRKIHLLTVAIAMLFLTYPLTSSIGVFPHQQIINTAASFNTDRASSLGFRFKHETTLLQHALEKPVFGWGTWGRHRIYDPETGADLSTTDGHWIITLGTGGWLKFITLYYFIVMAIVLAYKSQKYVRGSDNENNKQYIMAVHSLVVALILVDQMPNSSLQPIYWFVVGSLFGRSLTLSNNQKLKDAQF